jgi:hypothetical protein
MQFEKDGLMFSTRNLTQWTGGRKVSGRWQEGGTHLGRRQAQAVLLRAGLLRGVIWR